MPKTVMKSTYAKSITARGVLCAFAIIFCVLVLPVSTTWAEGEETIVLKSSTDSLFIGSHTYVTNRKPGSDLTEADIAAKHIAQERGFLLRSDILRIPTNHRQVWLAFSVKNRTETKNWMIDFGDVMDGRLGLVDRIKVYNDTTKDSFEFGQEAAGVFYGPAIPITMEPHSDNLFVVMFEGERGFPLTLSPKIISQDQYIRSLFNNNVFSIALYGFFFLLAMTYFGLVIATRRIMFLYFGLSYVCLLCIYTGLNYIFRTPSPLTGELMIGLYFASLVFFVLGTRQFLSISREEKPSQNILLFSGIGFFSICCLLFLTIFNQNDLGFLVVNVGALVVFVILIGVCVSFLKDDHTHAQTLIIAWSFSLISTILMCLITYNQFSQNAVIFNLYWYTHVPQGLAVLYTHYLFMRDIAQNKESQRIKILHDAQGISRLQKTKESAEQNKLLKVIEKERYLLKSLREQETKRSEEMSIARVLAERANIAKSAFLAIVSHEIRTPMTGIMGMVQLLRNTTLSRAQAEYVDTIKKSGDTMMALLNDILDFEKIEHGSMRIEKVPFNIEQLAQDVIFLMRGYAAQKKITLSVSISEDVPKGLYGDPTRLRQIFLNLIGNGIKFTEKGSVSLQINYVLSDMAQPMVRYSVIDTGIGITREAQIRLFTPFAQADESTSRKFGGTGLGLAISAKLVEAMGGKIGINSEENRGSTFYFSLPLEEYKGDISALQMQQAADNAKKAKPLRILVVEDNEINQKVLQGLLEREGHTLIFTDNGHEAIDMCKKHLPDIVLMDIQLSGLNGVETTKMIRMDPNPMVAVIPIIAVTGNVQAHDIEQFYAANINAFIAKPIDPEKLNSIIYKSSIGEFENPVAIPKPEPKHQEPLTTKSGLEFDENSSDDGFDLLTEHQNRTEFKSTGQILEENELSFDEKSTSDYASSFIVPIKQAESAEKESSELTEIQKYVQSQNQAPISQTDNVIKQTEIIAETLPAQTLPLNIDDFVNITMLENLIKALGQDQFSNLLRGFLNKSDEIITHLETGAENKNLQDLMARAHDLKGMAGNFGISKLSAVAAEIEKSAKTNNIEKSITNVKKLRAINDQTKEILREQLSI